MIGDEKRDKWKKEMNEEEDERMKGKVRPTTNGTKLTRMRGRTSVNPASAISRRIKSLNLLIGSDFPIVFVFGKVFTMLLNP